MEGKGSREGAVTKKDMAELKAYAEPPALVELTLSVRRGGGRGRGPP